MQYVEGLKEYTDTGKSAVTFGKFDGLHRGHQKLVEEVAKNKAENHVKSVLCAFDMNRKQVIMTREERHNRLEGKVDYLMNCPFSDDFRHLGAEDFIQKIIIDVFHAEYVVVGTDFHFGYGQSGNPEVLKQFEEKYNYKTIVVEKERYQGRVISSTYIKEVVAEGNMKLASVLLGYPYGVSGTVVHGKHLGRTLGFPTLNVEWPEEKLLPPNGVYLSHIFVDEARYDGITNIGVQPTVSTENKVLVESFLFGYDKDAYGKKVRVELIEFHRPEKRFESVEKMKECINQDIEYGKRYFSDK